MMGVVEVGAQGGDAVGRAPPAATAADAAPSTSTPKRSHHKRGHGLLPASTPEFGSKFPIGLGEVVLTMDTLAAPLTTRAAAAATAPQQAPSLAAAPGTSTPPPTHRADQAGPSSAPSKEERPIFSHHYPFSHHASPRMQGRKADGRRDAERPLKYGAYAPPELEALKSPEYKSMLMPGFEYDNVDEWSGGGRAWPAVEAVLSKLINVMSESSRTIKVAPSAASSSTHGPGRLFWTYPLRRGRGNNPPPQCMKFNTGITQRTRYMSVQDGYLKLSRPSLLEQSPRHVYHATGLPHPAPLARPIVGAMPT